MATQDRDPTVIATIARLAGMRDGLPGPVVATSGGFDPLHVGHLRCLEASRSLGATLVVIVNGDPYLVRKKGYTFMPLAERMEILAALRCVDYVVPWDDGTDVVSGALRALRPDIFAKGLSLPDPTRLPEWEVCRDIACRVVLDVGDPKTHSSTAMVERLRSGGPYDPAPKAR